MDTKNAPPIFVALDNKYDSLSNGGQAFLATLLHICKFGITTTYDELRRYRISVASAMEKGDREIAQFDSKQGLVQTVADNFDTQICSQNGQKSTHGLAMILTQAGCQQQSQNSTTTSQSGRICRLKWKETNASNLSGIIGSTLSETTLAVWALSHNTMGQMSNDVAELCTHQDHVVMRHKEERPIRITYDSRDRHVIREAIASCIDVFDVGKHPENAVLDIFTGRVIDDPAVNVSNAVEIGICQMRAYESNWPAGFHASLSKKVKTIAGLPSHGKHAGGPPNINTEFIYARVIGIMASSREIVSTDSLFSYELAPHPTALFADNGDMRTTSKSVLKTKLQILCEEQNAEPPVVTIVDGCALLWTVSWPAPPAKVSAFTTAVVAKIWKRMDTTQVLHVVFDRYNKLSIKSACRTARQDGCSRVFKLNDEAPLPGQAMALNVAANKEQLIRLLVKHLCKLIVPPGKRLVITGPDTHPIEVGVGALPTAITHEEADIIMVYHMIEESVGGHSPIRVVSDDTDVLLILAHHLQARTNNLPATVKVTMEACSGRHTVIDLNAIVQQHADVIPNLLAAHALTGCDTTSSMANIGKATVFKRLQTFNERLRLGEGEDLTDEVLTSCQRFASSCYGQFSSMPLEKMRARMFARKIVGKRMIPPKLCHLPPTSPAFKLHCQRAHFQTALWKGAGNAEPPDLDPKQHGWLVTGNVLEVVRLPQGQDIAPPAVLNLVSCNCNKCSSSQCSCRKYELTCTTFCKCMGGTTCQNPLTCRSLPDSDSED